MYWLNIFYTSLYRNKAKEYERSGCHDSQKLITHSNLLSFNVVKYIHFIYVFFLSGIWRAFSSAACLLVQTGLRSIVGQMRVVIPQSHLPPRRAKESARTSIDAPRGTLEYLFVVVYNTPRHPPNHLYASGYYLTHSWLVMWSDT